MEKASPSPSDLALGRAVREYRIALGWSQERLAFEAGFHRTYIGVIERGEKSISVHSLVQLAAGLDTTASELLKLAGY